MFWSSVHRRLSHLHLTLWKHFGNEKKFSSRHMRTTGTSKLLLLFNSVK